MSDYLRAWYLNRECRVHLRRRLGTRSLITALITAPTPCNALNMQQTPTCINVYSYRYTPNRGRTQEEVSEQPQGLTTIIVILLLYKQQNMSEVQISSWSFWTRIYYLLKIMPADFGRRLTLMTRVNGTLLKSRFGVRILKTTRYDEPLIIIQHLKIDRC